MKKLISTLLTFGLCLSAFAFDRGAYFTPSKGTLSYTKTHYLIESKFGDYFRTPNIKYQHIFNTLGQEIENRELTVDGKIIDKITYEYNENGKVISTTGFDNANNATWKIENSYNADGLKIEESEYNESGVLFSKSIYKYENSNCTEEAYYNGTGILLWKYTYTYDENNNICSLNSYYANGSLESKKVFKYNNTNKVQEISFYNSEHRLTKKEAFRYDANDLLTEITTYTPENIVYLKQFYKYDANGNIIKITTYNIAKKFGQIVNELIDMSDFTYQN